MPEKDDLEKEDSGEVAEKPSKNFKKLEINTSAITKSDSEYLTEIAQIKTEQKRVNFLVWLIDLKSQAAQKMNWVEFLNKYQEIKKGSGYQRWDKEFRDKWIEEWKSELKDQKEAEADELIRIQARKKVATIHQDLSDDEKEETRKKRDKKLEELKKLSEAELVKTQLEIKNKQQESEVKIAQELGEKKNRRKEKQRLVRKESLEKTEIIMKERAEEQQNKNEQALLEGEQREKAVKEAEERAKLFQKFKAEFPQIYQELKTAIEKNTELRQKNYNWNKEKIDLIARLTTEKEDSLKTLQSELELVKLDLNNYHRLTELRTTILPPSLKSKELLTTYFLLFLIGSGGLVYYFSQSKKKESKNSYI